ncbi:DUF2076 domain-containing protein [Bradyrhizobium viridifuturi]|uniref:DUF2076 domain-containing protein n=2 Tax=Nitrobacteraceae TaxID=41294 RepID=UPI000397B250|nr:MULTISPECIES: DUF2076 domain-containing protein [Bradyrhizobium]ERF83154.1 MAG: hypothetical protein C207_03476 [Bradyrhizobium sp. DFCI-1]OYU61304.1 MAG: ABC transporter substrate-binding protein [Bradyrhizobium sp. PARBB1]PSO29575.1 DUF2076 domain-containing protein [Bradyrhizobium sp. MOS004]QRI70809.1 DUF2076 domain-containing protein [Bradyrhizobium sp. PSBB068]MBR1020655.1 DUF2076 domain-containing protein [Bradyrhizobium viridifuturi]
MTPQERQLIDDLFDRLAKLENAPRDSEAMSAIMQGLRSAPNAVYALVQTALVQDEALKRAHDRIQELEAAVGQQQPAQQQGGFLDSMRDAIFGQGQGQPHGSVPPVRAPDIGGSRPVWNSGQAIQQAGGGYGQPPQQYNQPQYGQPYGGPQPPAFGGGAPGGGGGSFLGTAAAAAAGVVGGGLLLSSIRGMMGGGGHQSLADAGNFGGGSRPWGGDQSSSDLARDAGINDVGSSGRDSDYGSRAGAFDQAQVDRDSDDDQDADDFDDNGGDDNSDYA